MYTSLVLSADVRELIERSQLVLQQANASGSRIGLRIDPLDVFYKSPFGQEDGFNCHDCHADFSPIEYANFCNEALFVCNEAERRGLMILIDCKNKVIMPNSTEFFVDTHVIESTPEAANDN